MRVSSRRLPLKELIGNDTNQDTRRRNGVNSCFQTTLPPTGLLLYTDDMGMVERAGRQNRDDNRIAKRFSLNRLDTLRKAHEPMTTLWAKREPAAVPLRRALFLLHTDLPEAFQRAPG